MPTYRFRDTLNNDEELVLFMGIQEREDYLAKNPHLVQLLNGAPSLGDSIRMGLRKPDEGFRDRLREIKKSHSKGFTRSTVNIL